MSQGRCPHLLCCRSAYERELDEAKCVLDDCPLKPAKPSAEEVERRIAELTQAIAQTQSSTPDNKDKPNA